MENCNYGKHEHKPRIKVHHHHHDHDHEHDHGHSHDHRGQDKKVLKIALAITFVTMIIEFIAGFIGNSLALISDAIHMFTHSFALIISLVAIVIASKKAPIEKTFGYYRIEVLAAFINGITIVLSIVWILYEAVERFLNPTTIDLKISMIVAIIGLVVNIITGFILMQGDKENINLKSAFMHMLADALSSVAIIIGYIVIYYTNWYFIDILLALLVAVVIGKWAYGVLKDSTNTLLESSPVNIQELESFILNIDENILDIHDIHVWEITQDMFNITAHIKIKNSHLDNHQSLIEKINHKLEHDYNITHSTFQLEWEI
ncbi:cation diffusion facilitator family transporter [Sulfurospirillum arcachonense]|uniref:cation diffusion facilitator family transporter n=1 Tax=Sulfurospirillum arcachonense TaxID=57666 RepID=UPI00046920D4|nr:cation diffusion facilitator family transporter [Sulfurospirillum arcachonense]